MRGRALLQFYHGKGRSFYKTEIAELFYEQAFRVVFGVFLSTMWIRASKTSVTVLKLPQCMTFHGLLHLYIYFSYFKNASQPTDRQQKNQTTNITRQASKYDKQQDKMTISNNFWNCFLYLRKADSLYLASTNTEPCCQRCLTT